MQQDDCRHQTYIKRAIFSFFSFISFFQIAGEKALGDSFGTGFAFS
jgi:hypothetical protein